MKARRFVGFALLVLIAATPGSARADETDNFTCRERRLADALQPIDDWVNAGIREAIARANQRRGCDAACLFGELQKTIGANERHPLTWIPHARLARWVERAPTIDRCHVKFRESIYGARPYNQPWLWPFTGRIILLADSIRLSGRVVGIDKINHFVREGLAHWREQKKTGDDIAAILSKELGPPRRQFRMTEYGLKGWSLTGVLAYADLAASYSGFTFWNDMLSLERPGSFVWRDPASGRFEQRRTFTFAAYVNDAWDESINRSAFHPALAREVDRALRARGVIPVAPACKELVELPASELYVNPVCAIISGVVLRKS